MEIDYDFFIAHASADKAEAESLFGLLTGKARVFLDTKCLLPGDNWPAVIREAQRRSRVTLVLISDRTEQAFYEAEEIAVAIDLAGRTRAHRVIPIYLSGLRLENVPYGLRQKHALEVSFSTSLEDIAESLPELQQPLPGEQVVPVQPGPHIVLWGPPASGKTCFLATLNIAVAQARPRSTLVGANDSSMKYLKQATAALLRRKLPVGTTEIVHTKYVLSATTDTPGRRFAREKHAARLLIDIEDAAGWIFSADAAESPRRREVIDDLSRCDGIMYFYDPLEVWQKGDPYENFYSVISQLEFQAQKERSFRGGLLPHRVAVCVTKLDEPMVFEAADAGGHLSTNRRDPFGCPRVPPDHARAFFEELCARSREGKGAFIAHSLGRYFHPDRIRYFATSSLGFYRNHPMPFDKADHRNITRDPGDHYYSIRGAINPINVLEPLLWLSGIRK